MESVQSACSLIRCFFSAVCLQLLVADKAPLGWALRHHELAT
jgi:hypothetical protein